MFKALNYYRAHFLIKRSFPVYGKAKDQLN